jgi:hypothetical protein
MYLAISVKIKAYFFITDELKIAFPKHGNRARREYYIRIFCQNSTAYREDHGTLESEEIFEIISSKSSFYRRENRHRLGNCVLF